MPHDKSKTDEHEHNEASSDEKHEVQLVAQEAGISVEQAQELIDRHGHDRDTLMREAGQMLKQMR